MRLPSLDLEINFQRLRHSTGAQLARWAAYRVFVGREGWPLTFRRPPHEYKSEGKSQNLYIHLPFCKQICPHCPYNKMLYEKDLHRSYGVALEREIKKYLCSGNIPRISSLYFGGGTPSITVDLCVGCVWVVWEHFDEGTEFGVEVHPADASVALLTQLRQAGINRISLGIETFRADLLKSLGRTYTPEQAEAAIVAARNVGFSCLDVNLIYGIPGQQWSEPAADAEKCIRLGVDQISAYPLFTFVHTNLGKRTEESKFPLYGDQSRMRAQQELSLVCRNAGLARTSVWSFTRPGIAPYSTVTHDDYVGFGAGAGSKVGGRFWFNTFSVDAYIQSQEHTPAIVMQAEETLRRLNWVYWQVYRTEIDTRRYEQSFGRKFEKDFGNLIFLLSSLKLIRREENGIWRLTEAGAVWVHRLQCLYSLTYIDEIWKRCQQEAWPEEIVLN